MRGVAYGSLHTTVGFVSEQNASMVGKAHLKSYTFGFTRPTGEDLEKMTGVFVAEFVEFYVE